MTFQHIQDTVTERLETRLQNISLVHAPEIETDFSETETEFFSQVNNSFDVIVNSKASQGVYRVSGYSSRFTQW